MSGRSNHFRRFTTRISALEGKKRNHGLVKENSPVSYVNEENRVGGNGVSFCACEIKQKNVRVRLSYMKNW